MASLTAEEVRTILSNEGYSIHSLSVVFAESVFQATVSKGAVPRDIFIKVYSRDRCDTMTKAVESTESIGLPKSTVICDTEAILLSEEATGKQLSYFLPIASLPGLWRYYGDSLQTAYTNFGNYLARYHSLIDAGTEPVDSDRLIEYLSIAATHSQVLDERTSARIRTAFQSLAEVAVPRTLIHGDPSPHNMFYENSDITAIDYHFKTGIGLHDRILTELGIELMFRRLPHGREHQYSQLISGFNDGYQSVRADAGVDDAIYRTIKLGMMLKILYHYDSWKKFEELLTKRIDTYILDSMIQDALTYPGLYGE